MSATSAASRNRRWIAMVVGIVAILMVVLSASLARREAGRQSSPSVAASPSTGVEPSPNVSPSPGAEGFTFRPLQVVDDAPFRAGVAILVAVGSDHGHGGVFSLDRVYRDSAGAVRRDVLLTPQKPEGSANITSDVAGPNGFPLYAATCYGRGCSYEGSPKPGVYTIFTRSDDGGVSWSELGRRGDEWWLATVAGREAVAVRLTSKPQPEIVLIPSGMTIASPQESAVDRIIPRRLTLGGLPVWAARGEPRLVSSAGETVFRARIPEGFVLGSAVPGHDGTLEADFWFPGSVSSPARYLGVFTAAGQIVDAVDLGELDVEPGPPLSRWLMLGHARFDRPGNCTAQGRIIGAGPAILDLANATLAYIADPFIPATGCSWGSQRVLAVSNGPFARVNAPGDCLRIRVSPRLDADVLDCAASGVLLRHSNLARSDNEGRTWLNITTPAGEQGWAAADYLER